MALNKGRLKFIFFISHLLLVLGAMFVNILLFSAPFRNWILRKNNIYTQKNLLNPLTFSGVYFGATIDWEIGELPSTYQKKLGRPPALYQFFIEITDRIQLLKEFKLIVDAIIRTENSIFGLTVMPSGGLSVLNANSFDQIARTVSTINNLGVPVYLRFGHEMNGNWYPYGQRPVAYKKAFIELANAVRKYTSRTKMVWAPNSPIGYPWGEASGPYKPPRDNPDEFQALDTNRDGVFNALDDPFGPYYPGDEYVDIVGFSSFFFGDDARPSTNALPPAGYFRKSIDNIDVTKSIYESYCSRKNKPLVIFETASTFYPDNRRANDPSNLEIKRAWWRQLFNAALFDEFPLIKLIAWFDIIKKEADAIGNLTTRDFRLTADPEIRSAFLKDLPSSVYFADSKV